MRQISRLKKVILATTAVVLVGTTVPFTGEAHAASSNNVNAHRMVQDIFSQVGLDSPFKGKTPTVQKQKVQKQENNQEKEQTSQEDSSANQPAQSVQPAQQPVQESVKEQTTEQPKPEQKTTQEEANDSFGDQVIATGEKYLGVPYKFGAEYPSSGKFDCSSFTQYVFAKHGVKLPRTSRQQSKVGVEVPRSQMQKGDLVFFKLKGRSGIRHVGIYAGNGKLLHTWGPGGVRYDEMSDRWLDWGFVKATRVRP
ncbi:C40 family peptidase [Melghirimyces algeriensis]|uniref:Cell wall-associated hydrolase, NlpC family n=1 Tax=Melghirimyces algeriensis TaxID=910412 RepID=A0A521E1J5_9BACL|nr:C40 family peptidase [Melghirimyces algeriensis]SMO77762.1 Cell wall-associated hydrolase, NlpC family [Melghirimyces algeriensis]